MTQTSLSLGKDRECQPKLNSGFIRDGPKLDPSLFGQRFLVFEELYKQNEIQKVYLFKNKID
jgi:hypothetical protein